MSTEPETADFSGSVHPTSHPLVALCTITLPADTEVTVEFGLTTQYGRSTSAVPAPPGGGPLSFLVAGMMAGRTYQMRARVRFPDGKHVTTPGALFRTGVLPNIALPTLSATTSADSGSIPCSAKLRSMSRRANSAGSAGKRARMVRSARRRNVGTISVKT